MKKILIFVLMVFAIGCAKQQYVKQPEEEIERAKKEAPAEEVQKEVKVEEKILPREVEQAPSPTVEELAFELKDTLFDYDKYDIRPDAREVLDSAAAWLNKNKNVKILIEGHCDERGTNEYNLALGEKRATAARDYLTARGVAAARITTISYGEEKPVCTEHNESCWQKNRRALFVVTK